MKSKKKQISKAHIRWTLLITLFAFIISVSLSFIIDTLFNNVGTIVSFVILITIILIGILFDTIGVAVTVADEKPFHSMASGKVKGASSSLMLIRNASKVSNFCNDVIGDICGIISGSSAAFIIVSIGIKYQNINLAVFSVALSGFVAATTIGGKALGKEFAINQSKQIVTIVGKILSIFKSK